MDLSPHRRGIDRPPDILRHRIVHDPHPAGIGVQLDPGHVRAERGRPLDDGLRGHPEDRRVPRPESGGELHEIGDRDRAGRHPAHPHHPAGDFQVRLRCLQPPGGQGEELAPRVLRGFDHRRADGVDDLAAAGHPRIGRAVAIRPDQSDPRHRQAEHLGGDLRQPGGGPADIDGPDDHLRPPVGVEPDAGARGLEPAEPPAGRHTYPPPVALPVAPEGILLDRLQCLPQPDPRPGLAARHRVTALGRVPQAELDRVESEPARQVVEHGLQRECRLRCSGRPVGADRRLVRQDLPPLDVEVGRLVVAAEHERRDVQRRPGERPRVEQQLRLNGNERPVAARPKPDLQRRLGRRRGRAEFIGAGQHDPNRPPEEHRQGAGQGLQEQDLGPEPSTDRHGNDPDRRLREPEDLRDVLPRIEQPLGGGPDGQPA